MLVIVSGAPGAGKTTIAKRLGAELGLPVFDRDEIKDAMFDTLGWSDREWSKRVGLASWELLFALTSTLIGSGVSLLVESNFEPAWACDRFRSLRERHPFRPVEIYCRAEPSTLARRFRQRWQEGGRHPGHTDTFTDEGVYLAELAKRNFTPVRVDERVLEVDTTDPEQIDWGLIATTVREAMREGHGHQDR